MSSHLDVGAACRKRRGGEKVFKFKSFAENGCPVEFDWSFRENVKALLEHGHLENNLCNGLLSWKVSLNDTSKKRAMELRLLYGVAYGQPWYQALSDQSMVTLGDLFHFMLELRSGLPKENSIDSRNPAIPVETNCRWLTKRVEAATLVIVEALKRAEFRWVSRQEVRETARAYIGDTGLLDFVLKSLGSHIVGNYLVHRCFNPVTKVLEYSLEDIS
ncbi:hypothetical protein CRYUN_Cryun07bG0154500 [Craigia yunnanensis]